MFKLCMRRYGILLTAIVTLALGACGAPEPGGSEPERIYGGWSVFPFSGPAWLRYDIGQRQFGACRNGCRRLHAGVDLVQAVGHPVHAVQDGVIKDFYYFYLDTYALVVQHKDFVVRYGEVSRYLPRGIWVGQRIRAGQVIARVGDLSGTNSSMLHFEMYSGRGRGNLTQGSGPYRRRWDLLDPTDSLIAWPYPR